MLTVLSLSSSREFLSQDYTDSEKYHTRRKTRSLPVKNMACHRAVSSQRQSKHSQVETYGYTASTQSLDEAGPTTWAPWS